MNQAILLHNSKCAALFSSVTSNQTLRASLSNVSSGNASNHLTSPLQSSESSLSSLSLSFNGHTYQDGGLDTGIMEMDWEPLTYVDTWLGRAAVAMLATGLLTSALAAAFLFITREHPVVRACSYGLTIAALAGTAIELLVISTITYVF